MPMTSLPVQDLVSIEAIINCLEADARDLLWITRRCT